MSRRVKVISLWQPWALLWVNGSKIHETRGWPLHRDVIGTTIAVHAAKKWDKHLSALAHREPFFSCLRTPSLLVSENLHFGAIIGTVDIVRCVRAEPLVDQLTDQELAFGNFADPDEDRWAWEATNPVLFKEPIYTKGQQGFWMVDLP